MFSDLFLGIRGVRVYCVDWGKLGFQGVDFNKQILLPVLRDKEYCFGGRLRGWWLIFTGSSVTFMSEKVKKPGHFFDSLGPGTSDVDMVICYDWDLAGRSIQAAKQATQTRIFNGRGPRSIFSSIQFGASQTRCLFDQAAWEQWTKKWGPLLSEGHNDRTWADRCFFMFFVQVLGVTESLD